MWAIFGLLRRELIPRRDVARAAALATGAELEPRSLGKWGCAESLEQFARRAERHPRVRDPAVPTQPPTAVELQSRPVDRPRRELIDGEALSFLRGPVIGEHGAGVEPGSDVERPSTRASAWPSEASSTARPSSTLPLSTAASAK